MALARLTADLPPAVVVTDHEAATDSNPLRNYFRCLADPPSGATHVCVIQDDCVVCPNFEERLETAVSEHPDDMISLFVGDISKIVRKRYFAAMNRRESWCELPVAAKVFHVVALVWPVQAAADFLAWYPVNELKIPARRPHRSDDMVVSYWLKNGKPRRSLWATVPCLVEHPDDVPSIAHGEKRGGKGTDKGRRAIWFQG